MTDSQSALLERLQHLEDRVARLEQERREGSAAAPSAEDDFEFRIEPLPAGTDRPTSRPRPRPKRGYLREPVAATRILGWGGVAALVLAASYLIKLGVDLGWLTPARQLLLAFLGGAGLVAAGLVLKERDNEYASLLPAGGIVIWFLTGYGAHLYYHLIPFPVALAVVVGISLLALWFCHQFDSILYAYFAMVGSYSAPLLLSGLRASTFDLALYYSAWSIVFCIFSLWHGRRAIYLIAAYLALLGFDLVWYGQWHRQVHPAWGAALVFQLIQVLVFSAATILFTLRRQQPLDRGSALLHVPPLALFYVLEYALLDRFLPTWAPWIAWGSLLALIGAYLLTRRAASRTLAGGRLILGCYAALVVFHAGYLELLPDSIAPWAALLAAGAAAIWLRDKTALPPAGWPLAAVLLLVFVINLLRSLLHHDLARVPGGDFLALAYAGELYLGYALVRKRFAPLWGGPLLCCGHLAAMTAPAHIFHGRFAVSFCWALLAVICLGTALAVRDRLLARSSLFIFAAAGAKVLFYDLDHAGPLLRVVILVVLGISLYLGGWLYRKVGEFTPAGNPSWPSRRPS